MNTVGLIILGALALFQSPSCGGARTGLTTPTPTPTPPCCGDRNSASARVAFSATIAPSANQVPDELRGCGVNREEITAITIAGTLAGCVGINSADVTFPRLLVTFTTSAARCGGTQGVLVRTVALSNVRYTGDLRSGASPACISRSTIAYDTASSQDWQFNTLFVTRGRETLAPILDRFVLSWATSNPTIRCPLGLTFGGATGATSRCPS
jgi:hypothetical protein